MVCQVGGVPQELVFARASQFYSFCFGSVAHSGLQLKPFVGSIGFVGGSYIHTYIHTYTHIHINIHININIHIHTHIHIHTYIYIEREREESEKERERELSLVFSGITHVEAFGGKLAVS